MSVYFKLIENYSAEQLQSISNEQIAECIRVALDDAEDNDSVFEFVFNRWAAALSLQDIDAYVCKQVLPVLKNTFDEVLAHAKSAPNDISEVINHVQMIFEIFLQLLNTVHQKIEHAECYCLADIQYVFLTTLRFLFNTTSHTVISRHEEVKLMVDNMQTFMTNILSSPKFQLNHTTKDLSVCREVLKGLVRLGRQHSVNNNVKAMATSWKHVSKLAINFRTVYHLLQQQNQMIYNETEDWFDWLNFCIQNVSELIAHNIQNILQSVHKKDSLQKITDFYLKILQNLSKTYSNDEFNGSSHVIRLHETILDTLNTTKDEKLKELLSNLAGGFSSVLSSTYNCERFSTELLITYSEKHIYMCNKIIILLLETSTMDNQWYLNSENRQRNILHHMFFTCIPQESIMLYTNSHVYSETVYACSALLTAAADQSSLECILFDAVLSDDMSRMPLLLDVWCLFLSTTSAEMCLTYFKTLLDVTKTMPSIPRNPHHVLIRKMCKYSLSLLSDSQKRQIIEEATSTGWITMAMLDLDNDSSKLKQCAEKTLKSIAHVFTKLNPKCEMVSRKECHEVVCSLGCVELFKSRCLSPMLMDPQLSNCLTDALLRSKTRSIHALISSILRVLLLKKYLCPNHATEIDYLDSPVVKKLYILEVISLAQMAPGFHPSDHSSLLSSLHEMDDLLQVRFKKVFNKTSQSVGNYQNGAGAGSEDDNWSYFEEILNIERQYGCANVESCCNGENSAQQHILKQGIDRIVQEVNQLSSMPTVTFLPFSNEISFVSDFFNRLLNEMH